ncbi:Gfo/Idh/MocA family protein [Shewanella surugensis]|uniref:Gfo/Idh/MocA family oxidoreductase n=1 Tax=Shewanella surugensis TaxID=212020 RepID=A0ABT0LEU7_9GAMM|nr:Gfo/Idh/MocA family oxidoreductase [Shewanella surugensis]MCL1125860.1 Gfo/Idh/MocA family oxidoreductase [Shewanella surugensis]
MTTKLKWGILGTSFISGVMAQAILEEGHTQLHSVAGRNEDNLRAFANQYHIPNTYQDFDALISDNSVDIIYIALPNHLHHEFIIKAAQAGKAILCEKSLSVDMEKTQAAIEAIKQHNVFFAEGLMYLCHPFATHISQVINEGHIGQIKSISGQYCAAIAEFVNPQSRGALYNLGCYPASLMQLILKQTFGKRIFDDYTVTALGRQGQDGNICESSATIRLNNEVICQLHTAEDYGLHAAFTVLGTKGSIQLKSNPWLPEAKDNQLSISQYEQAEKVIDITADGNAFLYQVKRIREALEAGNNALAHPCATMEDSMQIMQLLTDWEASTLKSLST